MILGCVCNHDECVEACSGGGSGGYDALALLLPVPLAVSCDAGGADEFALGEQLLVDRVSKGSGQAAAVATPPVALLPRSLALNNRAQYPLAGNHGRVLRSVFARL